MSILAIICFNTIPCDQCSRLGQLAVLNKKNLRSAQRARRSYHNKRQAQEMHVSVHLGVFYFKNINITKKCGLLCSSRAAITNYQVQVLVLYQIIQTWTRYSNVINSTWYIVPGFIISTSTYYRYVLVSTYSGVNNMEYIVLQVVPGTIVSVLIT